MEKLQPIMKCDTDENWKKATKYIPKANEIIVYTFDNGAMKIKIGDGIHLLSELEFMMQSAPQISNGTLQL